MNAQRVPLQLSRGCVVASIQVELSDDVLAQFRGDLLEMVQASAATGVILDVSGIAIMDLEEFRALCDTMNMAALMGARTVFAGFQPGVVSALVELDAPTEDIVAAFNLDEAFTLLEAEQAGEPAAADALPPDTEERELEP